VYKSNLWITVKRNFLDLTIVGALILNVLTEFVNNVQFLNFLKMEMKFSVNAVIHIRNLSLKES
jgi:hypothetical protein